MTIREACSLVFVLVAVTLAVISAITKSPWVMVAAVPFSMVGAFLKIRGARDERQI